MRWDSPFVLALAGTIAIHLVLITVGDAIVVYNPPKHDPPAPHVELVNIEPPPVIQEPPPPVKQEEPKPPEPVKQEAPKPAVKAAVRVRATPQPTPPEPVPQPVLQPDTPTAPGGEQVVAMENVAPSATGVGVLSAKRITDKVGRGGNGGGTGAGEGSGAGEVPKPTSIAAIKKRAMPKGDYSYFAAGKDYPAEARQLQIEGKILVRLVVDEAGKVRSTVLVSKLGHGLDELALERAKQLVFEPAIDTDNHPVSSVVVWTFDMTLPK